MGKIVMAAAGFCELGMWQDAWDELEKLEPDDRARPDVLRLRLSIFVALERWDRCGPRPFLHVKTRPLVEKAQRIGRRFRRRSARLPGS